MKTIQEICPKPSDLVQLMVEALEEQLAKPMEGFAIDMSSYGKPCYTSKTGLCVGCAATATVQKAFGHQFTLEDYCKVEWGVSDRIGRERRANAIGVSHDHLRDVEHAIDQLRGEGPWPFENRPLSLLSELYDTKFDEKEITKVLSHGKFGEFDYRIRYKITSDYKTEDLEPWRKLVKVLRKAGQ